MQVIRTRCGEGLMVAMYQVVTDHSKLVPHNARGGIGG
jgi:hypothetical protein